VGETSVAAILNLDGNVISGNAGQGVLSAGANAMARISNNAIYNNSTGLLAASSGQIISFQNNRNYGNATNGAPSSTANLQ
jgi:lipid-binding SYLF domain-containing protein